MRSHRSYGVLACAALLVLSIMFTGTPPRAAGASIRLPDDFAEGSTRMRFEGFGGFNRGQFVAGEYRGHFTRNESRLGVFDPLYVSNRAASTFTLESDDATGALSASCRAGQKTATAKIVTFDLKKLVYRCEFRGRDSAPSWRFALGAPKREGFKEQFLARDRRVGEAAIDGIDLQFRSVHDYRGSSFTSQAPLGYLIESGGRVIAAVDLLDWSPVVHLDNHLDSSLRRAAVIVALALAVLRDPSTSALED